MSTDIDDPALTMQVFSANTMHSAINTHPNDDDISYVVTFTPEEGANIAFSPYFTSNTYRDLGDVLTFWRGVYATYTASTLLLPIRQGELSTENNNIDSIPSIREIIDAEYITRAKTRYSIGLPNYAWHYSYVRESFSDKIVANTILPGTSNMPTAVSHPNKNIMSPGGETVFASNDNAACVPIDADNGAGSIGNAGSYWASAFVSEIISRNLYTDGSNIASIGTQENPWSRGYFEITYVKNMYPATNLGTTSIGDIDFIWNTSFIDTMLARSIEPIPDETPEDYTYEIGKSNRYWDFSYIDTMYSQCLYADPSSNGITSIGNMYKGWYNSFICNMYAGSVIPASANHSTNVLAYTNVASIGELGKFESVSSHSATVAQWHTAYIGHIYSLANGYYNSQSTQYNTLVNRGPIFVAYMQQTGTNYHARMACVNYCSPKISSDNTLQYSGVRITDCSSNNAWNADSSTFAPRGYAYAATAGTYWVYFSSRIKLNNATTVIQLTPVINSDGKVAYTARARGIELIRSYIGGSADMYYYTYRIIIDLISANDNGRCYWQNNLGVYIVVYDIGARTSSSEIITKFQV